MKLRFFIVTGILAVLLIGCTQPSTAESNTTTGAPKPNLASQPMEEKLITEEEAQSAALKHAGFTADQVTGLRVIFEYDDGIPEYDVSFREGYLEYEYEIHAKTGQILSFEKDD